MAGRRVVFENIQKMKKKKGKIKNLTFPSAINFCLKVFVSDHKNYTLSRLNP